jgi:hypothetical protein
MQAGWLNDPARNLSVRSYAVEGFALRPDGGESYVLTAYIISAPSHSEIRAHELALWQVVAHWPHPEVMQCWRGKHRLLPYVYSPHGLNAVLRRELQLIRTLRSYF